MSRLAITIGALWLVAPVAAAQQPRQAQPPQQQQQQQQLTRMQQMHETMQHMERVQSHVHRLSQWMEQQRMQHGYQEMAQAMNQTGDQLQLMLRHMDQLHRDAAQDRDRLREFDRLHDRLRTMIQELDQAQDALRKTAGG